MAYAKGYYTVTLIVNADYYISSNIVNPAIKSQMWKILTALVFCAITIISKAQILKPVTWSYGAKRISASEAVIFLKANIDNGWHIYSQNIGNDGPTKTVFTYASSKAYKLSGKTIEPKPISHFDKVFGMPVGYF